MGMHELICRVCKKKFLIDSIYVKDICPVCDVKEFYDKLCIRKYALGFAGIGILILMFFKREKIKNY